MSDVAPLAPEVLDGEPVEVARRLLGRLVVSEIGGPRVLVRLTEVEAYAGEQDAGSHAFRGRTPRTEVMFGPPGRAYVYFTYGMHWCLNVTCGRGGAAAAVLLRAGEVIEGVATARSRRPAARADRDLARGPARLCSALAVDGSLNGVDLLAPTSPLRLLAALPRDHRASPAAARTRAAVTSPPAAPAGDVVCAGPRVGVGGAGAEIPWRFWLAGEDSVSAYRPHTPRRAHATGARSGTTGGASSSGTMRP